jgi:hypothetical protein
VSTPKLGKIRVLGRRRFVRASVAGTVLLAIGGAVAFVRTRGYEVAPDRLDKLFALSPWQLVVLEHAARRITAPDEAGAPTSDDVDVAGFCDATLARMPAATRRDLERFLAYVEHLAPIRAGFASRFTRLSAAEQDRVLEHIERGDDALLREGFAGLKALVFMGYYRDPRTWKILGYDGPLIGRPPRGWPG